jgi:tRNA dimethylallyltransferase
VLPTLAIMGPTASGKSAVALALATRMDAEFISVDSAQVYRGMDRGTAKPTAAERERIPHHLIDLFEPEETYSAGAFRRDALRLIDEVRARGRVPILVGGTMLYFDALMHGIAELPGADAALRAAIDAEAAAVGWPAMHQQLATLDPAAAATIRPNDRQRIQRALEINRLTGRSLAELRAAPQDPAQGIAAFALVPADRGALHERIGQRLDAMFDAGLVDEVQALHRRPGLSAESPAMRAVGYRQIWSYLDGRWDLPTARERAAAATRNLAKRQLTWLNRFPEAGRIEVVAGDGPEALAELMLAAVAA